MSSASSGAGAPAGGVDLAAELHAIRDQGAVRGTCLAFAVTAAHEQARLRRCGDPSSELCVELLYWRCKQLDGRPTEQGTDFGSARDALLDPGQASEALWPYDPHRDQNAGDYAPPAEALDADELRRASLSPIGAALDDIRRALDAGRVVIAGLELWDGFYDCDTASLAPPAGDVDGAGHAVCLVGYDDTRRALKVRNSWGERWGEKGYAWLSYDALPDVLLETWVAADDLDGD
jgi:C1A family cysteine protease